MRFTEYFFVNKSKKVVFFPINKNASTTYIQYFKKKTEWLHTDVFCTEYNDYVWFAHIQNPRTRYIKGIAEIIYQNKLQEYLNTPPLNEFLIRIYHDKHAIPIDHMFGDAVRCINFIPIEGNSNKRTYDFLCQMGIDYPDLLTFKPMNKSDSSRRAIQQKISDLISNRNKAKSAYEHYIKPFYENDNELWKLSQNKTEYPYTITYTELLIYQELLENEIKIKQGMDWSDRIAYAFRFLFRR